MPLESATHINDFVTTNPAGSDSRTTADDHLRLIKDVLKRDIPFTEAVTSTAAELNILDGVTSSTAELNLLTGKSLSSSDNVIDNFPAGTLITFQQTSAPTGWTKQATHNNKALRVVSGTASNGGSVAFTTAFASKSVSGTVGGTTLTIAQVPAHSHSSTNNGNGTSSDPSGGYASGDNVGSGTIPTNRMSSVGGGGSHNHSFSGTAINMTVQYVDIIIASKD